MVLRGKLGINLNFRLSAFLKGADLGLGCEEPVCSFERAGSVKLLFLDLIFLFFNVGCFLLGLSSHLLQ